MALPQIQGVGGSDEVASVGATPAARTTMVRVVPDAANPLPVSATINVTDLAGDVAHDEVDSGKPVKIGGQATSTLPTAVSDGDRANIPTDLYGRLLTIDEGTRKTLKSAVVSLSATGHAVALVSSKKIKVFAYKLVCDAALVVNFRSGASTALEGAQSFAANGGCAESVNPPSFLFATAAGEDLDIVITGTGNVRGRVSYWDDDAT